MNIQGLLDNITGFERYLSLVAQNPDIQSFKNYLEYGDLYVENPPPHALEVKVWDILKPYKITKFESWVPTQTQLQKLIIGHCDGCNTYQLIVFLQDLLELPSLKPVLLNPSFTMEEAWLHLAMWKVYDKALDVSTGYFQTII
jgi:hypothetical protein